MTPASEPVERAVLEPAALRDLDSRIGPAKTLHALLGSRPDTRRFRHDAHDPVEVDVLIVDEASMVHLEMMAALLAALPPNARVVLLGDKDQLASVEAGAVLGELCQGADGMAWGPATREYLEDVLQCGLLPASATVGSPLVQQTVTLRESRRFAGPIGALATAVNAGDAAEADRLLDKPRLAGLDWLAGTSAWRLGPGPIPRAAIGPTANVSAPGPRTMPATPLGPPRCSRRLTASGCCAPCATARGASRC